MNHLIIDTETTGLTTNSSRPTKNNPQGLTMTPGEKFNFTPGHSQPYMIGMGLYDESWNLIEERKFTFRPSSVRSVLVENDIMPTEEGIRAAMDDTIKSGRNSYKVSDLYHKLHLLDADNNLHMENLDAPQPFELGAAEVSGANPEEVYALEDFTESGALEAFRRMSENAEIVAYNADFDVKMLCYEAELNNEDIKDAFFDAEGKKKYLDAMEYSTEKIGIDSSLKLEELVHAIQNEERERNPENRTPWYTQTHDALEDVRDTAKCMKALEDGMVPSKNNVIRALKAMRKSRRENMEAMRENAKGLEGEAKIMQLYQANEESQAIQFALDNKIDHISGNDPVLAKTEIDDPGKGKRELSYIEVFGINGDGNTFRYNTENHTMTPDSFGYDDKPESFNAMIERAADIKGIKFTQAKSGYERLIRNALAQPYPHSKNADKILKPVWDTSKFVTKEANDTVKEFSTDKWGVKMPNTYLKAACEAKYGSRPGSYMFDFAKENLAQRTEALQKAKDALDTQAPTLVGTPAMEELRPKVAEAISRGADAALATDVILEENVEGYEATLTEERAEKAKKLPTALGYVKDATEEQKTEMSRLLEMGMKPEMAASTVVFSEERTVEKPKDAVWEKIDEFTKNLDVSDEGKQFVHDTVEGMMKHGADLNLTVDEMCVAEFRSNGYQSRFINERGENYSRVWAETNELLKARTGGKKITDVALSAQLDSAMSSGMKPEGIVNWMEENYADELNELRDHDAETTLIDPSWTDYEQTVARAQLENFGKIRLDEYGKPRDDIEDMAYEEEEKPEGDKWNGKVGETISLDDYAPDEVIFTGSKIVGRGDPETYVALSNEERDKSILVRKADGKCVAEGNDKDGIEPVLDYLKEHGTQRLEITDKAFLEPAMAILPDAVKAGDVETLKKNAEEELIRVYGSLEEANEYDGKEFVQACIDNGYSMDYGPYSEMEEIADAVDAYGLKPLNNVELYKALVEVENANDDMSTHDLDPRDIIASISGLETKDGKPFVFVREEHLTPEEIEESAKEELRTQFGSLDEAEKYGEMGYVDACKELGSVIDFGTYQHMEEVRDSISDMDCKPVDTKTLYDTVEKSLDTYGAAPGNLGDAAVEAALVPNLEFNDGTPAHEVGNISQASENRLRIFMADNRMDEKMTGAEAVQEMRHPDGKFHEEFYPAEDVSKAGSFELYVAFGKAEENDRMRALELDEAKERVMALRDKNRDMVSLNVEVARDTTTGYYIIQDGKINESCAVESNRDDLAEGKLVYSDYDPMMDWKTEETIKVEIPKELYDRLNIREDEHKLTELRCDLSDKLKAISKDVDEGRTPTPAALSSCAKLSRKIEPLEAHVKGEAEARKELFKAMEPAMLECEKNHCREQTVSRIGELKKEIAEHEAFLAKLGGGGEKNAAKEKSAKDPELV